MATQHKNRASKPSDKSNKSALKPALSRLRYRSIQSDRSRSPVYVSSKSEDAELPQQDRQVLISEARQITQRDFALAGFCVRSHLQYVSYYDFRSNTKDREFNAALEKRVERWSHKSQCDVQQRCSLPELLYLIELGRVVDGDIGVLRVNDSKTGGRIQLIESDRIRTSTEIAPNENWVNGVKVADNGRILAYDINKRKQYGGFEHERFISAKNMDLLGYRTRVDQIRGVSPLSGALRLFSQLSDCIDINLAKARLESCLGLAVFLEEGSALVEEDIQETEKRVDGLQEQSVDKFGSGVFTFYGTPAERVELINSSTPSTNFQAFVEQVTRIVLLSLDIPYSIFDPSSSNFFGSKASLQNYIDGVEIKQRATKEWLTDLVLDFLLPTWVLNGEIELPTGYTIDDLRGEVGWNGAYFPTWLMLEQIYDAQAAIQLGVLKPSEFANSYGYDIRENIDDIARLVQYANEQGVNLPYIQGLENG